MYTTEGQGTWTKQERALGLLATEKWLITVPMSYSLCCYLVTYRIGQVHDLQRKLRQTNMLLI